MPRFHRARGVLLVEPVLHLIEHPDAGVQRSGLLRQAVLRLPQLLQLPDALLPLLDQALHGLLALRLLRLLPGLQPGIVLPQLPTQGHPLRLQVLLLLSDKIQALPLLVQFLPGILHGFLLLSAGQHMELTEDLLPPPLQALFLHPQHLQVALGISLPLGNLMELPGQLPILQLL